MCIITHRVTEVTPTVVIQAADNRMLPRVVAEARKRAGHTCLTAIVSLSMTRPSKPKHVYLSPDTHRMANGLPIEGEYYSYLSIHPLEDRKKDTYMGVSRDPIKEIYHNNHSFSQGSALPKKVSDSVGPAEKKPRKSTSREAHLAAPYWSLASALGPHFTHAKAERVNAHWSKGTRGIKSKLMRGHVIAQQYASTYFGRDVKTSEDYIKELLAEVFGDVGVAEFEAVKRACVKNGQLRTSSDETGHGYYLQVPEHIEAHELFVNGRVPISFGRT